MVRRRGLLRHVLSLDGISVAPGNARVREYKMSELIEKATVQS